jgi:anthranilate synthase component 1
MWQVEQDESLPPLTSGLVGFFSWDLIRQIEALPQAKPRSYQHPILQLQLVRDLVVIDHLENSIWLISNVYCLDEETNQKQYEMATAAIEELSKEIRKPLSSSLSFKNQEVDNNAQSNFEHQEFLEAITTSKEYVRIGDVFQVVISQRFEIENKATPLEVYRSLRSLNPSPYMYLFEFLDEQGPYAIVGSSPEALVKVNNNHAVMHPIAGSRPRGKTAQEDQEIAVGLLADAKEKAEHLMLVDLARNDLLKVCNADSVAVTEFMKVVRFSHIMHLVSTVEGNLRENQDCVDVFRATFPAGTLSGAPKPRALEIIEELEPNNRGIFGGAVGYLDFAGNADLAIAIRTAFLRNDQAFIQAGAGIVLDSEPESEYQETISKSSAVVKAIQNANRHI